MAKSQNGWTVLTSAPPAVEVVPGVKLTIRPGDVAVVLAEVARRFHAIEPIDAGTVRDDWGWAYRPVRGQVAGFSNHAAGTAIDLNALKHVRGVHGTFKAGAKAAIRAMVALFKDPETGRPVVRWGEDYSSSSTIDGMHFEINADEDAVRRVADAIRARTGAFAEHDEGEADDMLTSDKVKLGPANAAELEQKDAEITVGEALSGTWAETLRTRKRLDALISEQRRTNELLQKLIDRPVPPTPAGGGA